MLRGYSDPPEGLAVSIAWDNGDGMVTELNVWDAPGAIADNYMEPILPVFRAEGNRRTSRSGTGSRWRPI